MIFGLACFFLLLTLANVFFWPRVRHHGSAPTASLSILIPARNEEENIAECLDRAISQGPCVREILVYDDHSTDRTAESIKKYQAQDSRIHRVSPQPLPPEWLGKNFACAQLAQHASADWILFLDADARLQPHACDSLLNEAKTRNLSLLSAWPSFEMRTYWEGTLMPMLNFVVFSIFPGPLSLYRRDRSLGLAHGACMLFQRSVYERLGGHSAVRREIFEDTRLAQLWRTSGERGLCLDGRNTVRVRMYASFEEIWLGFQKNFYPAFQRQISFWAFVVFHFFVFLLPFFGLFWPALLIVLAIRGALAIRFRQPWWSPFTHPIGEAVMLALAISSWHRCRTGRGVVWKGRQYLTRT